MSSGPEHYCQAEESIAMAQRASKDKDISMLLQQAQVHATLALAAATALGDRIDPDLTAQEMGKISDEWGGVLA